MNKTNISKEKIIEVSINVLKAGDINMLNIRNIANLCDVSVGSIYNYFSDKTALIVSLVESVWKKVFNPELFMLSLDTCFTITIKNIYERVYISQKEYRNFFNIHQTLIEKDGVAVGKTTMSEYIINIKKTLVSIISIDKNINTDIFNEQFTKEGLIDFVFSNLMAGLSNNLDNCDFLIMILDRVLY